jgi:pyruvate dehydrogenase phosphatase
MEIDTAIMKSFCDLDDKFISDGAAAIKDAKTLPEVLSKVALGMAGSCAILSVFDPNSKNLRVACVGDSRAVLGSHDQSGRYIAKALSVDQTGFNELEIARMAADHPGEPNVIDPKTGRVLGIMVSRAFGDGLWKWPKEIIIEARENFFGKAPRPDYATPPYLTAEPVVTTTQILGKGEFVIMASDGLWDNLSSDQAVKLVEMWLVAHKEGTIGKSPRKSRSTTGKPLKIDYEISAKEENFVVEDDNVATHLVRNAFGGADHERLCAIAGVQSPLAREVRDDVTVQVIFFEDTQ